MHIELFSIGGLHIYTYGLMIAAGILLAYVVCKRRGEKMGMDMSYLENAVFTVCIWGFLASKLLYMLTRLPDMLKDPSQILDLSSGWVVYGGIIGGLAGGVWYCRKHHLNFLEWFDLMIPEVALAQALGRIGCFFAGCCYGIETDAWFGVIFPESGLAPAGIKLIPTQLISSGLDFLLFGFLLLAAKHKKFNGELGGWYLVLYSIGRFLLEFWRGDLIRGEVGILSTSQFISIFTCILGIAILVWGYTKKRKA